LVVNWDRFIVAFRDSGEKEKAVATHEQAVREAPDDVAAVAALANSLAAVGKKDLAWQTLEAAQAAHAKDSRFSAALAEFYSATDRRHEANVIYERLIGSGQAPISAYISVGALSEAKGDFSAAEKLYRSLLRAFPDASESYFRLGSILAVQKRYDDAVAVYDKGLAIDPEYARLLRGASVADLRLGETARALARAKSLVDLTESVNDRFYLGTVLEAAGDKAEAQATYRSVLKDAPTNWQAMNNLAVLLAANGGNEAAEAVSLATRAIELAPGLGTVTDTLGWSQLQAGDAAGAIKTLSRAAGQAPRSANIHYHLALAEQADGDRAAARRTLQLAVKLDPEFAAAKRALQQLDGR
jgi:tetratricopeptide (TPR) repeat protein